MGWLGWNWVRGVASRLGELGVGVGRAAAPVHTHPRPSAGQTTIPLLPVLIDEDAVDLPGESSDDLGEVLPNLGEGDRAILDHDAGSGALSIFLGTGLLDCEREANGNHPPETLPELPELRLDQCPQCRRQIDMATADDQIHALISSMIPGRKESSAHTGWGRSYGMETHRARVTIPSLRLRCV